MSEKKTISACVVTYNNVSSAPNTVRSVIENTKGVKLCMFVADNNSTDDTVKTISKIDGVNVIRNKSNEGFGKAHNSVIEKLDSDYHAVINPDIEVDSDVLSAIAEFLDTNPDVVMVTPKILSADGTEQQLPKRTPNFKYVFLGRLSGVIKPFKKYRDMYTMADLDFSEPTQIDFCTGCFFVMRTEIFKKLGGFDERFFMYMEDADITRRAKRYGKTVFLPTVSVTHLWERASSKSLKYLLIHLVSCIKYFAKWRKSPQ